MKRAAQSVQRARASLRRARGAEVGFVITPEEIANKVQALDKGIQKLAAKVYASKEPKVNAPWRAEFQAFLRRWAVERDSYATWSARLFATRAMPRIEEYEKSYQWWAKDFEKRTATVVEAPEARPQETMAASVIPTELYWVLGGVLVLSILSKRLGL
jgi:hypothetical protein